MPDGAMPQSSATPSASAIAPRGSFGAVLKEVDGTDIGMLVVRIGLGVIFLGHGLQKLGWFKGGGFPTSISTQKAFLQLFGYSSTTFLAWVITLTEVMVGVSLLLGLLTPLGSSGVIGIMFQTMAGPIWAAGLFGNDKSSGFDMNLVYMAAAAVVAFAGPGRISVDSFLRWRLHGTRWGLIAIAVAVVVGTLVLTIFGVGLGGRPSIPAGP